MQIIDDTKLEELLIANWAKFINHQKLMAFVLNEVNKNKTSFSETEGSSRKHGFQISLSRFQLVEHGFIVWAEFAVPVKNQMAIGTTELFLTCNGILHHKQTIGNLHDIV